MGTRYKGTWHTLCPCGGSAVKEVQEEEVSRLLNVNSIRRLVPSMSAWWIFPRQYRTHTRSCLHFTFRVKTALYRSNEFYKVIRYYVDLLDFEADHCLSKPFLMSSFLTCIVIDGCQPIIVYLFYFIFFLLVYVPLFHHHLRHW